MADVLEKVDVFRNSRELSELANPEGALENCGRIAVWVSLDCGSEFRHGI